MKLNKYIAIGHWADNNNVTSVSFKQYTLKDFKNDLGGNNFIAWLILTEKAFDKIVNSECDRDVVWDMITKKVTNYRKWDIINEYIAQCLDIMQDKMKIAE